MKKGTIKDIPYRYSGIVKYTRDQVTGIQAQLKSLDCNKLKELGISLLLSQVLALNGSQNKESILLKLIEMILKLEEDRARIQDKQESIQFSLNISSVPIDTNPGTC